MNKQKVIFLVAMVVVLSAQFMSFQEVEASRTFQRDGVLVTPGYIQPYQPPSAPAPTAPAPTSPGSGSGDGSQIISSPVRSTLDRNTYVAPIAPPPPPPSSPTPSPAPSPQPPAQIPAAPSWLTAEEAKAFELLNKFRVDNNLPPLQIHSGVVNVARLKAHDIADNNYFSHVSPTYGTVPQMLKNAGISYSSAAENLSKAGTVSQAHIQLVYSTTGHRQIMLSPNYTHVGIGIVPLKNVPGIIMVQIFIR
ncbi:MAG: CAP domain-containing protein [Bacillota bacterium]|nr:CAP domain-containing protein [Bacillota bacterium]